MQGVLGQSSMLRTRTTCGKSLMGVRVPPGQVSQLRAVLEERHAAPRSLPSSAAEGGIVDLRDSSEEEGGILPHNANVPSQDGSVELLSSGDEAPQLVIPSASTAPDHHGRDALAGLKAKSRLNRGEKLRLKRRRLRQNSE